MNPTNQPTNNNNEAEKGTKNNSSSSQDRVQLFGLALRQGGYKGWLFVHMCWIAAICDFDM